MQMQASLFGWITENVFLKVVITELYFRDIVSTENKKLL